jgi:hypothetical protein
MDEAGARAPPPPLDDAAAGEQRQETPRAIH